MAIISQQTWNNFSSEKKKRIREDYYNSPTNARKRYLEAHYGKENLISITMAIISQVNLPVVGKQYNHYDDGKIRPSRHSVVKVTKVIPYSEVNDKLKTLISSEQEECDWLFAPKTDFVVFANTINEDDPLTKEQIYIRTKNNGWFSIDHETCFDSGRLDIDHTLTDSVIEQLHEGGYDYTTEEIEQILTEFV